MPPVMEKTTLGGKVQVPWFKVISRAASSSHHQPFPAGARAVPRSPGVPGTREMCPCEGTSLWVEGEQSPEPGKAPSLGCH